MRPVNLLPEQYRPRASGQLKGSSYVVVGVLGVLLLMVAAYVVTSNQVNSRQAKIDTATQEAQAAEARAGALAAYGNFATIKETRVRSVRELASARFDWERLMREVAVVLPSDIWLTDLTASTVPKDGSSGSAPAAAAGAPGASVDPSLNATGCARDQRAVAVLMVRLRKLHRAKNVELSESAQQGTDEAGGDSGGATSDGCPGKRYKFTVAVSFDPAQPAAGGPSEAGSVPARLGGGS